MSAAIEQVVIPVRNRTKQKSVFEILNIKGQIESYKFNKVWADRNLDNGELIIDTLEIEPIIMDQFIFIEESKPLMEKLDRIGFEVLNRYPNISQFDTFSVMMYNRKYNVAISIYKPQMKKIVEMANSIAEDTEFNLDYKLSVFISAVKMLNK